MEKNIRKLISPGSYINVENMGKVTIRNGYTSRGTRMFQPFKEPSYDYILWQLYTGSNSISKLEIVSALNSFNLATLQYHYNVNNCPEKYNPKVYFGTVQTTSKEWMYEQQTGSEKYEKSGSWPNLYQNFRVHSFNCFIVNKLYV